jgi:hypothetical protein
MVDNFKLIGQLINQLSSEGLVFDLLIIQRKKDNPEHKSGNIIYRKLIRSEDSLIKREFLIKTLCEHYGARAYINLSPKSNEEITKKLCSKSLDDVLYTHNYSPERILGAAIGDTSGAKGIKLWVVDIDFIQKPDAGSINMMLVEKVRSVINSCRPEGNKIFATIPTRHGIHFITFPFDLQEFKKANLEAEVKKDNPTLLYYPNSLEKCIKLK